MSDLAAFYTARLDEIEAAALAAQAIDPAPWTVEAHDDGSTWQRNAGGAGLVTAADQVPLWDCEGSNMLCMTAATARHVALHDPAYVLADVAAKRRILADHDQVPADRPDLGGPKTGCRTCHVDTHCGEIEARGLCETVRDLVAPHAEHPDFQPGWRTE